MYKCRNTGICIGIYIYVSVYVYMCTCLCICIGIYAYVYVYMCTCMCISVLVYAYTHRDVYIYHIMPEGLTLIGSSIFADRTPSPGSRYRQRILPPHIEAELERCVSRSFANLLCLCQTLIRSRDSLLHARRSFRKEMVLRYEGSLAQGLQNVLEWCIGTCRRIYA